jgi:hypothetical protein
MAFSNAQQARLLINYAHLSGVTRGFNIALTVDALDVTTLADTAKQFLPGLRSGSLSLDMLLDTGSATGSQWDTLTTWQSTNPTTVSVFPSGLTANNIAELASTLQTQLTDSSQPTAPLSASLTGVVDGAVEHGVVVETLQAITVDTTGTSIDCGAATTNGGVAHLHVTAYSGLTSDVLILEHSVDNSVWATLGTFTTVTALTSQRLVVASGTTVRRYLRVSDDVTGTGSITRAVTFARR